MKFYNRERELQRLDEIAELAADSAQMLVVTGRRRIGKTELVRQFSKTGKTPSISLYPRRKHRFC